MWNLMAANRLLEKRSRQKQYIKHRKTLSNIRPQIDNLPPVQYDFLVTRPKARLQAHQKYLAVQADNQDLVRRMIQPKPSQKQKKKSGRNSLHSTYFKHIAEQIQQDNAKLVNRLQGTSPCVNFGQMEHEHKRHMRWKETHKKPPGITSLRPFSAR